MNDLTDFFSDTFGTDIPVCEGRTFFGKLSGTAFNVLRKFHILLDGVNMEKYFEQFCSKEKRPRNCNSAKAKLKECNQYLHFSYESLCEKTGNEYVEEELFLRQLGKPGVKHGVKLDSFCERYEQSLSFFPTDDAEISEYNEMYNSNKILLLVWKDITKASEKLSSLLNALMSAAIELESFSELDIINCPSFKEKFNFSGTKELDDELDKTGRELDKLISNFREYCYGLKTALNLPKSVFDPQYLPSLIKRVLLFDELDTVKSSRELAKDNPTLEVECRKSYTCKDDGDTHTIVSLSEKELQILKQQYESMYGDVVRDLYYVSKNDTELKELFERIKKYTGYYPEKAESDSGVQCSPERIFYEMVWLMMDILDTSNLPLLKSLAYVGESDPVISLTRALTSHSLRVDFDTIPEISFSHLIELRCDIVETRFFEFCIKVVRETASRKYQLKKAMYEGDSDKFDSLLYDKEYK